MKRLQQFALLALVLLSALYRVEAQQVKASSALLEAFGKTNILDEERRQRVISLLSQDTTLILPLDLELDAELVAFSDRTLRLKTSAVGSWELRLLPLLNSSSLTSVIERVTRPQADARITFLDQEGEVIKTEIVALPTAEDFLRSLQLPETSSGYRLRELLRPLHYQLSWADGQADVLLVTPSLLLTEEDKASTELAALIAQLPSLASVWDGKSFAPFTPRK
ncbi:hypothetical protein HMPREF1556_00114 [Porphyromonas sp. oral taxon 278 str. W7784]|jgi:hypothetical protein|uniref:DUF3256 family protein n=1 Tax=Porphyromonas sp. oral taxon 278 TaxID=712437 RepID=UPI0003AD6DE7|nr:DUF3256 family protein [Porphyromonas sp. oral taxon 278]ERJ73328.1 hypothetical protein HMPREF1556_00114 [Porphyromonas sp. oral taxon 278 str. W7784]